jgi:hypothetical protein
MQPLGKHRLITGTQIGLTTVGAAAAAWFWALPVILCFISYMYSPSHPPTDAQMIRELWPFRLVQPEWLSRTSDQRLDLLVRWEVTETTVRLSLIFLVWAFFVFLVIHRHRRDLNSAQT